MFESAAPLQVKECILAESAAPLLVKEGPLSDGAAPLQVKEPRSCPNLPPLRVKEANSSPGAPSLHLRNPIARIPASQSIGKCFGTETSWGIGSREKGNSGSRAGAEDAEGRNHGNFHRETR